MPLQGGGWEGVSGAEEKETHIEQEEASAGACEFWIRLGGTAYSREMDSVPRLISVFTLLFSGLWHLGLTATNCEYRELRVGGWRWEKIAFGKTLNCPSVFNCVCSEQRKR